MLGGGGTREGGEPGLVRGVCGQHLHVLRATPGQDSLLRGMTSAHLQGKWSHSLCLSFLLPCLSERPFSDLPRVLIHFI